MISCLDLDEEATRRLSAFGLMPGEAFRVQRIAPLGGPFVLQIGTTSVLIRRNLARLIQVKPA